MSYQQPTFPSEPHSLEKYVGVILSRLPDQEVAKRLGDKLGHFKSKELYPQQEESLYSWVDKVSGKSEKLKLMLVLGESRSKYRVDRSQLISGNGKMTMASTCDGVGSVLAILGLLKHAKKLKLKKVDFDAQLDEWPTVVDEVVGRHLVVVGTGEVNILATFLHLMVEDFFCGNCRWPPNLPSLGDKLNTRLRSYHRNPRANIIENHGAVILLKNPWNTNFRLLWIAGLTGQASVAGCSQVALNWESYRYVAEHAIGVIFSRVSRKEIKPEAWLVWDADKPVWVPHEEVASLIGKNQQYQKSKSNIDLIHSASGDNVGGNKITNNITYN